MSSTSKKFKRRRSEDSFPDILYSGNLMWPNSTRQSNNTKLVQNCMYAKLCVYVYIYTNSRVYMYI